MNDSWEWLLRETWTSLGFDTEVRWSICAPLGPAPGGDMGTTRTLTQLRNAYFPSKQPL